MSDLKDPVKKVRSTLMQINFLTDYMAQHTEFSAGRFVGPQGAQKSREMWQKLAESLAELGPAKSAEQWKITWRDLKCKSRARNADAKRAAVSTGNTSQIPVLSDITQRVINIIGRATSEGSGLPESSIGEGPEEVVVDIEYSNELQQTASPPAVLSVQETGVRSKPKRRKLAATPDVGERMATAQEASNDVFKDLVGTVKRFTDIFETFQSSVDRIGDIFERYTATQEERVQILRQQILRPTSDPVPSTSQDSTNYFLQLEESQDEED